MAKNIAVSADEYVSLLKSVFEVKQQKLEDKIENLRAESKEWETKYHEREKRIPKCRCIEMGGGYPIEFIWMDGKQKGVCPNCEKSYAVIETEGK